MEGLMTGFIVAKLGTRMNSKIRCCCMNAALTTFYYDPVHYSWPRLNNVGGGVILVLHRS